MAALAASSADLGGAACYRVPRHDGHCLQPQFRVAHRRQRVCECSVRPVSVASAEAYAAEFGRVYLNFNPQDQGLREQQLAEFVPASIAADVRTADRRARLADDPPVIESKRLPELATSQLRYVAEPRAWVDPARRHGQASRKQGTTWGRQLRLSPT